MHHYPDRYSHPTVQTQQILNIWLFRMRKSPAEGRLTGWEVSWEYHRHYFLIKVSQMVPEDLVSATCAVTRERRKETEAENWLYQRWWMRFVQVAEPGEFSSQSPSSLRLIVNSILRLDFCTWCCRRFLLGNKLEKPCRHKYRVSRAVKWSQCRSAKICSSKKESVPINQHVKMFSAWYVTQFGLYG